MWRRLTHTRPGNINYALGNPHASPILFRARGRFMSFVGVPLFERSVSRVHTQLGLANANSQVHNLRSFLQYLQRAFPFSPVQPCVTEPYHGTASGAALLAILSVC